jgi:hypothetical protein
MIPMTEAKLDLIRVGRTETDAVIIDHYQEFKDRIDCCDVEAYKPDKTKLPTFRLNIKSKCDIKQRGAGSRKRYYVLREEQYSLYDKLMSENEDSIEIDV